MKRFSSRNSPKSSLIDIKVQELSGEKSKANPVSSSIEKPNKCESPKFGSRN